MMSVEPSALLSAWDAGHAQAPERWALTLLALADPSAGGTEAMASLSIGQRDARLLACRIAWFGRTLGIVDRCPRCRTAVELELDGEALLLPATASAPGEGLSLRLDDGHAVDFRLPDSHDFAAAAATGDAERALTVLLERCVTRATAPDGRQLAAAALPAPVVEALSTRMAELDPQAELTLRLRCAACDHDWRVVFDVLPFLWCELDAWSTRLLREVHTLASRYGWTEERLLAMGAARRRRYLDLIDP